MKTFAANVCSVFLLVFAVVLLLDHAGPARLDTVNATEPVVEEKCPYDIYELTWSGKTKVINGRTWFVMTCPAGHEVLRENAR
jgi:hypothetical protein